MKRFTNHHEPWGTFVDVKINAVNIIKPMKYKDKRLLFSSVTDAYQPIESKYELTRKLLMALIPAQPKIEILTKSSLVLRLKDIEAIYGCDSRRLDINNIRQKNFS